MVTAQEIRSAQQSVSQQQRELQRSRRTLESEQKRLTTAAGVRTIPRTARQLQQQRISGITQQVTAGSQRLEQAQQQLAQVSTQLQAQQKAQSRIDQINRIFKRIGTGKNVGSEFNQLTRADQSLVTQAISEAERRVEGISIRAPTIPTATEEALLQSLPAGIRELSSEEIRRGQSLIQTPALRRDLTIQVTDLRQDLIKSLKDLPGKLATDFKTQQEINRKLQLSRQTGVAPDISAQELEFIDRANLRRKFNVFSERFFFKPLEEQVAERIAPESILRKQFIFDPSELALGVVFFPILQVGAVKKGRVKVVVKQKKKTAGAKSRAQFTENELDLAIVDSFKKKGTEEIRDAYRRALQTNNKKFIKQTEKLISRNIGKDTAKTLFKDVKQQELILPEVSKRALFKGIPQSQFQNLGPQLEFGPGLGVARIPQASVITGGIAAVKPFTKITQPKTKAGKADQKTFNKLAARSQILATTTLGERFKLAAASALKVGSLQKGAQQSLQTQINRLQEQLAQPQATRTAQRQRTRQLALLRTRLTTIQRNVQRQRSRFARTRPRPRRPLPPPLLPSGKPRVAEVPKPTIKAAKAFDVFSFKGGKRIRISKKPFKTRKGARDFGALRISNTLRASFFVLPSSRKGVKKVSPRVKGSFNRLRLQFRPSKNPKRKGVFVEKRTFRLEKGGSEVKEIKQFKRRVKPLIRTKKKRR